METSFHMLKKQLLKQIPWLVYAKHLIGLRVTYGGLIKQSRM